MRYLDASNMPFREFLDFGNNRNDSGKVDGTRMSEVSIRGELSTDSVVRNALKIRLGKIFYDNAVTRCSIKIIGCAYFKSLASLKNIFKANNGYVYSGRNEFLNSNMKIRKKSKSSDNSVETMFVDNNEITVYDSMLLNSLQKLVISGCSRLSR